VEYVFGGCKCKSFSIPVEYRVLRAIFKFAEVNISQKSGSSSRRALERAMYARIKVSITSRRLYALTSDKALYDADYKTDKVLLIQSVILMGLAHRYPRQN
jgi:hypothetical protein